MAGDADVRLRRHAAGRRPDCGTFRDADLRLDDVDAGDHFGHRVLDLDARIDFDEIELAGVCVLQELDGAGIEVPDGAPDAQAEFAEFKPLRFVEENGRRALDDLLVATLHRAVALVEVHQVAVLVAEDLHFDVARAPHQLLEVDLVVAEGGFRLTPCRGDHLDQLRQRRRPRACRGRRRPSWP